MKRGFIEKDNNAYLVTTRLPRLRLAMTGVRGFTLIELLVVVLIIGILAAIALPQYQTAVDKAQFVQLIALVKSVKDAEEIYYMANGQYSTRFSDLDITMPGGQAPDSHYLSYPDGKKVTLSVDNYVFASVSNLSGNTLVASYIHSGRNSGAYASGRLTCQAAQNDSRAQKLCLSLGGVHEGSGENCVGGACYMYLLP